MKTRTKLLITASILFLGAFVAYSTPTVAQEAESEAKKNPFAGKIVTIYVASARKGSGHVLTNAELREISGRTILVGIGADTDDDKNWTSGVQIGVAWDSISTYYAMTPKQYKAMLKKTAK